MRALLISFGTTGDAMGMCTLAMELQRHGHQPVVAVPPHCAKLVHHLGLSCAVYGPDVSEIQLEVLKVQNRGPAARNTYNELVERMAQSTPRAFSELSVMCRDTDVLICSLDPPLGLTLHETTGVPFVALHLDHPFDDSWYREAKVAGINRFRVLLGLRAIEDTGSIDPTGISPQLTLFAVSRFIFPPLAEWPAHYHVTGFFYPGDEKWEPEASLLEFIDSGEPPVVITFGSMLHEGTEDMVELLIAATREVGCRCVLQIASTRLFEKRPIPSTVYPLGFASHTWLFSRADCVVHHGSPGTAAAVFRAGIPGVIVPHAFQHFEFADRVHALGCIAPPLPLKDLSVARLSAAIDEIRNQARYREAAVNLRNNMRTEDGVGSARRLIEGRLQGLS